MKTDVKNLLQHLELENNIPDLESELIFFLAFLNN